MRAEESSGWDLMHHPARRDGCQEGAKRNARHWSHPTTYCGRRQMRMVRSNPAEAAKRPSGANATVAMRLV